MFTVKRARGALRKYLDVWTDALRLIPRCQVSRVQTLQTFLSDHNLHHGMVPPAGTVDQVGYECAARLDLVERLPKGAC